MNRACWSALVSVEKNDCKLGRGRPTLKGKEKASTGMEMAPGTLHGLRCQL